VSIYDALPERRGISPIWQGWIVKDINALDVLASVIIPDIDSDLQIDGCMWMPRPPLSTTFVPPSTLNQTLIWPKRGDDCLVVFDNDNRPWITVWWPYAN
jgi:hypothetical protein